VTDEERPVQPWLRIEFADRRGWVWPDEAARLRDGLHAVGGEVEERLATLLDAKATELLASPLYAGTVSLRIDPAERTALLALLTQWKKEGTVEPFRNLEKLWLELRS
jgi:hypothetical protein